MLLFANIAFATNKLSHKVLSQIISIFELKTYGKTLYVKVIFFANWLKFELKIGLTKFLFFSNYWAHMFL